MEDRCFMGNYKGTSHFENGYEYVFSELRKGKSLSELEAESDCADMTLFDYGMKEAIRVVYRELDYVEDKTKGLTWGSNSSPKN